MLQRSKGVFDVRECWVIEVGCWWSSLSLLSPSLSFLFLFLPQDLVRQRDTEIVVNVIDKDLDRTFPSHVLFAKAGSQG